MVALADTAEDTAAGIAAYTVAAAQTIAVAVVAVVEVDVVVEAVFAVDVGIARAVVVAPLAMSDLQTTYCDP